jgi:flagellar biosynthesis/type III secretory pathway protein FliH
MRNKYPSQIRYENENPTITFRMKIKEKEKIENMAHHSGKSISELVRYALLGLEKDFTHTYESNYSFGKEEGIKIGKQKGYNNGYTDGMNNWAIGVPCWKCHKTVYIKPNSTDYEQTLNEMKGRLSHDTCPP